MAALVNKLCSDPEHIRNVCILAHVDHGKTTLSDYLISSNGIISNRMAGQVRYLDNRPDEQERCITMKSSSIALSFRNHLINLVDSPGHIDFSSEVSTATRLCDGALVLVDVVEGVQVQTQSVLREAWNEGVKPCLVLNKMDRLIVELKLSPSEAYHRCRQVIEQVNALVSTFHTADLMSAAFNTDLADDYHDQIVFSPELGNVAFASASEGWAFTIKDASRFYSKLLGMNEDALLKVLWGEFYYNPKTKSLSRKATNTISQPMFVQYVLTSIWQTYECVNAAIVDTDKIDKLIAKLSLSVARRDVQSRDGRTRLQAIMRSWYPLAQSILDMCLDHLPSPVRATDRLAKIWPGGLDSAPAELKSSTLSCSSSYDDPILVVIAKMIAVDPSQFTHSSRTTYQRRPYVRSDEAQRDGPREVHEPEPVHDPTNSTGAEEPFMALGRVFSGRLRSDVPLYVFLPRYEGDGSQESGDNHRVVVPAGTLKLFSVMGADLEPISEGHAGQILAIAGLSSHVLSAATISSYQHLKPFKISHFASSPIVRVAVEPHRTGDLSALSAGLRLLAHADPNIDVVFHQSGQIHLVTSGELHLERCLRDLKDRFAVGIAIRVSPPVIPFRETICGVGKASGQTRDNMIHFDITIRPLPSGMALLLEESGQVPTGQLAQQCIESLRTANGWQQLNVDGRIAAFGPSRAAANLFIFDYSPSQSTEIIDRGFIGGFQAGMLAGTLCEEPMMGVAVIVDDVRFNPDDLNGIAEIDLDRQLRGAMKSAIRGGFVAGSPRLVEAMYRVQLQCTSNQLGNLCNVLARRRGRTVRDEMIEGTDIFVVESIVPVESSIGLSQELRSRTSGSAAPQLLFSHWEPLQQDPDWVPTTAEEIEEFGVAAGTKSNFARELVDRVRRRKGLHVKEHIVEHAEKQSTSKHS
uniref:Ribosome assembly protein 1 n=1 Tax=Spongospora subterranea TaxID=70186 RepID=A0A0H5QWQ5_9EUKA|eukprot:CRZ06403.1 hypothetical protein [Spongospora subterranea]